MSKLYLFESFDKTVQGVLCNIQISNVKACSQAACSNYIFNRKIQLTTMVDLGPMSAHMTRFLIA